MNLSWSLTANLGTILAILAARLGLKRVPDWLVVVFLILIFIITAFSAIAVVLLFAAPFVLIPFWHQTSELLASQGIRLAATAIFLLVGGVFFLIRTTFPRLYGTIELAVGAAGCWAGLGTRGTEWFTAGWALLGGVYIMVRGLDNMTKGWFKSPQNSTARAAQLDLAAVSSVAESSESHDAATTV